MHERPNERSLSPEAMMSNASIEEIVLLQFGDSVV